MNAPKEFNFMHKGAEVVMSSIQKIKLGNKSDSGTYRGDIKECELLFVQNNEFCTNVLARVVDNPKFIVCATYVPHNDDAVLYSTNARSVPYDCKTIEAAARSMGFDGYVEEAAV
jgi:hypothetical protein